MSNKEVFSIDLSQLKKKAKEVSVEIVAASDLVGAEHGFIERSIKKRGRQKSLRTGQVHAKVLPHISDEIADEAKRRGVQQGVLIEEAWELYCTKSNIR